MHIAHKAVLLVFAFMVFIQSGCAVDSTTTSDTGSGRVTVDTTPPTVLSTSPANGSSGVAVFAPITATFSEALSASTVTSATFTLNNGVTGTVRYSGTTATFTPSSNLAYATTYIATITAGIKDSSGNVFSSDYAWTFTTQPASINDTGISANTCYQAGSDVLVACNSPGAIALSNAQDGMVGRDANASTNSNSDGRLGFSFTSISGGCVQDKVTGLMWEVKTNDGGLDDLRDWAKTYDNTPQVVSGGVVQIGQLSLPPPLPSSHPTSVGEFIYAVNATSLCGYNDWRLPSVDELQSIVDYSVTAPGPTIDAVCFPNTKGGGYWSSTPHNTVGSITLSNNWLLDFSVGRFGIGSPPYGHYIRLVRSGASQVAPSYTVSSDRQEEVTDNRTNLIWRRCLEGMVFNGITCTGIPSTFSQEAAMQQATALALSSGFAWRLPNLKELSSIAYKNMNILPAVASPAFPAAPSAYLWSSTPYIADSTTAWHVYLGDGSVSWSTRSLGMSIRLVRSGL